MPSEVTGISSAKLAGVVRSRRMPAVVLFPGAWCPDCKRFDPTWNMWTSSRSGPMYAVDVPRGGSEWDDWSLVEIPTAAVFIDGREAGQFHGTISSDDLDSLWAKLKR